MSEEATGKGRRAVEALMEFSNETGNETAVPLSLYLCDRIIADGNFELLLHSRHRGRSPACSPETSS